MQAYLQKLSSQCDVMTRAHRRAVQNCDVLCHSMTIIETKDNEDNEEKKEENDETEGAAEGAVTSGHEDAATLQKMIHGQLHVMLVR